MNNRFSFHPSSLYTIPCQIFKALKFIFHLWFSFSHYKKWTLRFFQFVFIFIFPFFLDHFFLYAQERKEFYNEIRGLGMGGARIASINDGSAILVNPSALGKLREPTFEIVSPEISLNKKVLEVINLNLIRSFDLKEILNQIKEEKGSVFHQKVQMFPSFSFKNFGLGLLMKFELDEEILNDQKKAALKNNQPIFISYTNDIAFATGFSLPFLDGRLKLGAGFRFINRVEAEEFLDFEEVENVKLESIGREGFGVGKDIGITFSLPKKFIPTFSAVLRDIGDTKYDFFDGFILDTKKRPRKTPQSLDLGFSMISIFEGTKILSFSAEFRDVLNARENIKNEKNNQKTNSSNFLRRTHAGLEFNLNDSFFIRAGVNQRYWTAGFEFAKVHYQWQVAVYGEDIGTTQNPEESRRFVCKFTFRL